MNQIRTLQNLKFNNDSNLLKSKSNFSTISISNTTKYSSKVHLSEIFEYMDSVYALSDLAELLEKETGGKFTQLTFREIIDKTYPELTTNDKIFLLKHIPLSKVGITPYSPLIFLLYLFRYIQSIIKEEIFSPSLIFYSLADKLQFSLNMTTIDYFHSIGLEPDMEISMNDFYLNYGKKFGEDELKNIILFKSVDYDNDGKIKIEDLILVIDSYRNDNLNEQYFSGDINIQNNAYLLKLFLEENFISIDLIYENAEYNYMKFIELRSYLVNEIYNYKRYSGKEDTKVNEILIDNVLCTIKRNEKIFKNDFQNYLGEFVINSDKNINGINVINLNEKQKYWINKFIDMIVAGNSTPKMIFNITAKDPDKKVANIIELMKQVLRFFPSGKLSTEEMQNIITSLDINNTGLIEINQYEIIINTIQNLKKEINLKENERIGKKGLNEKIINIWSKGIKSNYYNLLPAKGNYEILNKINKDIKNNIIFDDIEKENDINSNNINGRIKKKIKKNNFIEQKIGGDMGAIYEEVDEKTGKKEKYYTNDPNLAVDKTEVLNEYSEEELLKIALDNLNFENINFSKEDLLTYLLNNKIKKEMAEEVVKYLDNNDDGLISIINVFKFLLYELKYKSSKLVLKYLYLKIYKELEYKSSKNFFKNNKLNPLKVIKLKKLCEFLETFYIDSSLTKKIYEILKYLFKPPIVYNHLCQLIDDFQLTSLLLSNKNNDISDEKIIKIEPFDVNLFDKEIKNIVRNLIEINDYDNNKESSLYKKLSEKIYDMLSDNSDNLTYISFVNDFCKKLNISQSTQDTLFLLLKHYSKNKEQQLISKTDIISFLVSYIYDSDISNDIYDNNENEALSIAKVNSIIKKLEEKYPPLKYAFEKIPFRCNGVISCAELLHVINSFYNHCISKNDLTDIISCLDEEKKGVINFSKLQLFLNNYSEKNDFSPILEIEIIATKLYNKNILNAVKYFTKSEKMKNLKEIGIKEHKKLLGKLCSSEQNMENLLFYMTNQNKNSYYNMINLADKINFFLIENNPELILEKNELSKEVDEYDDEDEDLGIPDMATMEKYLKLINLGPNGYVSIYELLIKMKKGYRKALSEKIDKKKKGYISFPEFIKKFRKIYGTEINLNYKLCAQYLFKAFIINPNQTKNFILNKSNQKNINTYLEKQDIYNNFMFAFCNDKYLFENFYNVYSEKKGKYKNKLNLNSFLLFIYGNNLELKSFENNLRFNTDGKDKIDLSNKKIILAEIFDKNLTNVREIIDKINIKSSKLQKNFSISEKYFKTLLETHFNFNEDDTDEICTYFRMEEGKLDIKKFFEFDSNNIRNIPIILQDDIIPRIQNHISTSIYKSYKEYKKNLFHNDYFDICDLYLIFNKLYHLTLYHCLVLISWNKDQFLSIEKFFKENNLTNYFPSKELEPTLKLAVIRLYEYLEENFKDKKNDKLKIFKGFDTNKDGMLSPEEFFEALNSIENLELNENQKFKLFNLADTNSDGKINASEFLELIKSIKNYLNDEDEMNAPLPASMKKNENENIKYFPKILEKDITSIKSNYNFNMKKIKKLKKNHFLSYLVNLQLDLFENYYSEECMENDFLTADENNEGYAKEKIFEIILKKRLVNVDDKIINLFIKFSEEDIQTKSEDNEYENEEDEDSNSENKENKKNNKMINYKIFLNKLANYKIKNIEK